MNDVDLFGLDAAQLRIEQTRLEAEKDALLLDLQDLDDKIFEIKASTYTRDALPSDTLNEHRVGKLIIANRLLNLDTKLRYINDKIYELEGGKSKRATGSPKVLK